MGDLRQGIGLIHKLRELTTAKELFDRRCHWFRINQVMWHSHFEIMDTHALANGPFHTHQTNAQLVLQ